MVLALPHLASLESKQTRHSRYTISTSSIVPKTIELPFNTYQIPLAVQLEK